MDETAQELMTDLAEAMERMPSDPKGLAGWLLSNYRLRKIGSGEPVQQFYHDGAKRQPRPQQGNDIDTSELRMAESPVDNLLKRTDYYNKVKETQALVQAAKGGKDKRMAALANSIQHAQESDPHGLETSNDVSIEDEIQADSEDLQAYQEMAQKGENPFVEPTTPPLLALASQGARANISDEDPMNAPLLPHEQQLASTPQGQKVMLENRLKRAKAQSALQGGGDGAFRRG